ncbi:MAG: ABC transporter ATP-binding protein [Bacteroidetes bacterium]|nr:ABC transporter ATP-binding protein [Bacteroidota bacterium]
MKPIIEVNGISKRYKIGKSLDPYLTIRDSLFGIFKKGGIAKEEIWALKDVSFDVTPGDSLGIIGANGAGKSTLLKILSRITYPTSGKIIARGRIASLLEVGTGFHPELTGRENVYLNGSILGLRRNEINARYDAIVDFSGVEKFLDTPLKHYSTGMQLRLAFAVAAHLDPEILVIDEVLAVGDAAFQRKCLGKMEEVTGEGRTILFVSHNMNALRKICNKGILLENGSIEFEGSASDAVSFYLNRSIPDEAVEQRAEIVFDKLEDAPGDGKYVWVRSVRLCNSAGETKHEYDPAEEVILEIRFKALLVLNNVRVVVHITTADDSETFIMGSGKIFREIKEGEHQVKVGLPLQQFKPQTLMIKMSIDIPGEKVLLRKYNYLTFDLVGNPTEFQFMNERWSDILLPELSWKHEHEGQTVN